MIFVGRNITPPPPAGHFDWNAPDFGGHTFEASFVDAEPMERDQ